MNRDGLEAWVGRSQVYAALATGFRYPDPSSHAQFSGGKFAAGLLSSLALCDPELAEMARRDLAAALVPADTAEQLQAAFVSAFETDMPTPSVSLYEGSHVLGTPRPPLLLELKGFYRTFGLEMSPDDNDLEDSLAAELEFMQFLAAKIAQAQHADLSSEAYRRAGRDFIERHLAAWMPSFHTALAEKVRHPFYRAIAKLADDFVAKDAVNFSPTAQPTAAGAD